MIVNELIKKLNSDRRFQIYSPEVKPQFLFNYNLNKPFIHQMSVVSPLKRNLLQLQITPAKAIVTNDINSWNETSQKMPPKRANKQRCSSKTTHYVAPSKPQSQEMSNLASLRERRLKLLESSCKKKSLSQQALVSSLKNSPKSTQLGNPEKPSHSEVLQKTYQFKLKITEIKVTEFKEEDSRTVKPVEIKFKPRAHGLPSLGHKNQQQIKSTLHRLRTIQSNMINSHKIATSASNGASIEQQSLKGKTTNENLKNIIFKARRILPIRQNVEPIDCFQ